MNNNTCKHCGKGLNANYRSKLYCSQECGYKYRYRKKAGVSAKKCQYCNGTFKPNENGAKYKYCSDECFDGYRRKDNRKRWRKQNPGWSKEETKECEWCGTGYTVPGRVAHRARYCSEQCRGARYSREVRGHQPIEEHNAERRRQKVIREKRLETERVMKASIRSLAFALRLIREEKEECQRIEELTRNCEECGNKFYDPHPSTLACSDECRRRRNNRVSRLYRNNRYNEHNLIDKDITLTKLYERDKGICYLCGKPCDYDDITITEEGHYIVGRNYPSIDHVLAIANGGHHSWSNVRLSHHYCNTIKRDKPIENKHEKAPV